MNTSSNLIFLCSIVCSDKIFSLFQKNSTTICV